MLDLLDNPAGAVRDTGLDPTGATDCGPLLQALFDDGTTRIDLAGSRAVYLLDSPVFLDSADPTSKYVIYTHGAKLMLGAGLPGCADFFDPAVQIAFFPGTKRSALQAGTVTCAHNRAAGAFHPRLTIVGGVADGSFVVASGNRSGAGLVMGNFGGNVVDGVTADQLRFLTSAFDYSDGGVVRDCYNNPAGVADSWLHYPTGNGDSVTITRAVTKSSGGVARLNRARGAVIDTVTGGSVQLTNCDAVSVRGAHIEMHQNGRTVPGLQLSNSRLDLMSSHFSLADTGTAGPQPAVVVDDAAGESHSELRLNGVEFWSAYYTDDPRNTDRSAVPAIRVDAMNPGSRITAMGVTSKYVAGQTVVGNANVLLVVASGVASIQRAITAGAAQIATGFWTLAQGPSGTWEIANPLTPGLQVSRRLGAPTLAQVTDRIGGAKVTGTLANGTSVEYCMALLDTLGNVGPVSACLAGTPTCGVLSLGGDTGSQPGLLTIWRKVGGSAGEVRTAPDAFVTIGLNTGSHLRLYDTGANIAKTPWRTAAVPSVPAADTTVDAVLLDGRPVFANEYRQLSGPVTISATTSPTDIGDLQVLLAGRGVWTGWWHVVADPSAAAGLALSFDGPPGCEISWNADSPSSTLTDAPLSLASTLAVAGDGTPHHIRIEARISTTEPGAVRLRAAQVSAQPAGPDDVTIGPASYLSLDRRA